RTPNRARTFSRPRIGSWNAGVSKTTSGCRAAVRRSGSRSSIAVRYGCGAVVLIPAAPVRLRCLSRGRKMLDVAAAGTDARAGATRDASLLGAQWLPARRAGDLRVDDIAAE